MHNVRRTAARRIGLAWAWAWTWTMAIALWAGVGAPAAHAARLVAQSPQDEAGIVRQVSLRFDEAVVPAGNLLRPAPYTLQCQGAGGTHSTPAGDARWVSDRLWVLELRQPLPAGLRCTLQRATSFVPLNGPLQAPDILRFATGAPQVVSAEPEPGSQVEEDQHFLLRTNGAVDAASLATRVWCEVEGLGERMAAHAVTGAARDAVLRQRGLGGSPPEHSLLLACQRPFPAAAGVRLVWGAGVAAAGQPALVTRAARRFEWTVRPRFMAEFRCERENASAPCLPLRPMVLFFSAPVPRAVALQARLQPAAGAAIAPSIGKDDALSPLLDTLRFAAPFPENMRYTLVLPAGLKDDSGRPLANASGFPLTVATGGMPPLAKFASAPFGIVETGSGPTPEAVLPFTLRHVQADLANASTGGQLRVKTLPPSTPDTVLLAWMAKLRSYHERDLSAKEAGLPANQWTVMETETDDRGRTRRVQRERRIGTRELSLLAQDTQARRSALPQLTGSAPRATEVLGLPLQQPGYHVVEIESRVLGNALLAQKAPMYVRTGVLATNLGVHFKRGRTSSLVWVTSLDRARPVAGATVAVNDCRGQQLWAGTTDAAGIARVPRGFDDEGNPVLPDDAPRSGFARCTTDDGMFVTARSGSGAAQQLGFVFSGWQRGIEPWRFNIPAGTGTADGRLAHTVFDRTLLRAGETLSMKHFVRDTTPTGLAWPAAAQLPAEVVLTHLGSGNETVLPLAWPRAARSAESRWLTPKNATLGVYDVALRAGTRRWDAGSFRIEAFRVPLVDARLAAPSGDLVAPAEVALQAQLNALAGGPMPGAPLQLSALLRPASPTFRGFEDYSFQPAGKPERDADTHNAAEGADISSDGARLVAHKLAASTDAQGAARIVVARLPALDGPSDLQAELSFNDPNGEVQTVAQRVRLWPARVVVGVRAQTWASGRSTAALDIVVLDTRGTPLKGRNVDVLARVHQTFSTRTRLVGGFYGYDNQRQTRELGKVCSGSTDAQGRVACSATLDASGEVELVARAKDDNGRSSEAATTVWMNSGEAIWFAQDNDDRIDLLPEQRDVEPGQTARLQVRMPFRQATVLVTVERDGIVDARVVQLQGKRPVLEVPIPKLPAGGGENAVSWAPNVTVSALVLRGRLREAPWWSLFTWGWRAPQDWWQAFRYEGRDWKAPTALVDLAKPSFKLGATQLNVGAADQRLDVAVRTDKTHYAVRETVKAVVRVTHGGKPLAGTEVAFAAVDEGLLALQPNASWDLLDAMLRPRPWAVDTATAQGEIIGRRHDGRKAMAPGGGGGKNPTRELFDTLLLWRGTVQLDANGESRIDVPLNDSLTSFKLVAIADAGGSPGSGTAEPQRFGTGHASVRVSQDLQLLPGLPPLARSGDSFDAGFTLRNSSPQAMTVRASLSASVHGAEGSAPQPMPALQPQTVQLAAGAATEVRWKVAVPDTATRIDWVAEAADTAANTAASGSTAGSAGPARDRVQTTQAVLPAVPVRVWQGTLQPLEASALPWTARYAPPEGALPGSGGVQASLQPRLTGALPGVRRFFQTYPYTCLEQTTSRAIGLRDNAAFTALGSALAGYLDSDGLAHYFPPQPGSAPRGSDRLTAYLLSTAHEAGWAWPTAQRDAMLGGLAAFVEGRLERRFNAPRADLEVRKLAALDALSRHGRAQPRMLDSITLTVDAMATWPTSALLDAWSILRRMDGLQGGIPQGAARLADVQRLLRLRLSEAGTTLRFSTEATDDWWWLMDGPDANAARLLLLATAEPSWKDDLPRLLTGTLARQKGGAWRTTTANLWGVLALERFAAKFEAVPVAGRSALQFAGHARTLDWAATPNGGTPPLLPWPATAGADGTPLAVRHEGAGRPWLTLQALAAVPLRAPVSAGYRVTRSVTAVERKHPQAWSRGDVLRVRLQVDASADMAWAVVSDTLPAGATLLGSGLGRDSAIATRGQQAGSPLLTFEERGADSWRGYFEWLPRGTHVVDYTMRLNTAGRFNLPPTRVEAMYAPETFGEAPNMALDVQQ